MVNRTLLGLFCLLILIFSPLLYSEEKNNPIVIQTSETSSCRLLIGWGYSMFNVTNIRLGEEEFVGNSNSNAEPLQDHVSCLNGYTIYLQFVINKYSDILFGYSKYSSYIDTYYSRHDIRKEPIYINTFELINCSLMYERCLSKNQNGFLLGTGLESFSGPGTIFVAIPLEIGYRYTKKVSSFPLELSLETRCKAYFSIGFFVGYPGTSLSESFAIRF
jgi:hypothetical protein